MFQVEMIFSLTKLADAVGSSPKLLMSTDSG